MLDSFANYFWQHPAAVIAAAVAIIVVLIWMTGSGSRQRFIVFKRTKETDQLARDLGRIATALERIAHNQQSRTDYVGRPIPTGWEDTISAGAPAEEEPMQEAAIHRNGDSGLPIEAEERDEPAFTPGPRSNSPAAPNSPSPARVTPGSFVNPLGGSAGLLGGKKKLDLPNPLYRPK